MNKIPNDIRLKMILGLADQVMALTENIKALGAAATAPKRIVRGKDGRAEGVEVVLQKKGQ